MSNADKNAIIDEMLVKLYAIRKYDIENFKQFGSVMLNDVIVKASISNMNNKSAFEFAMSSFKTDAERAESMKISLRTFYRYKNKFQCVTTT